MFKPDGPFKLELPDGTSILNFASLKDYLKKNSDLYYDKLKADNRAKEAVYDTKYRDLQLEMASLLDRIPSTKINPGLKYQLANSPEILTHSFAKDASHTKIHKLMWPPNSKNPKLTSLSEAVIARELKSFFDSKKILKLKAISNEMPTPIDLKEMLLAEFSEAKTPISDELKQIKPDREARIKELFEFTKKSIINSIVGSKPEGQWSDAEKSAITKINSINFNGALSSETQKDSDCLGVIPNASYFPPTNSITLCPGFYHYPEASIVAILGHELSHAIDPCNAQFGSYKFDSAKFKTLTLPWTTDPTIATDYTRVHKELKRLDEMKATSTALRFEMFLKDPKNLDFFINQGVLTPAAKAPPKFRQTNDDIEGYIFADVFKCLRTDNHGGFRQISESDIQTIAESAVQTKRDLSFGEYNTEDDRKKIVKAFSTYPQCVKVQLPGQMGEAMADWVGARALGDFVQNKKFNNRLEQVSPIAFFAASVCSTRWDYGRNEDKTITSSEDIMVNALNLARSNDGEHAPSKNRLENIFLSEPRLRQALDCNPTTKKYCPHNLNSSEQATSKPAGTDQQ
jgi:hypothetical protein